MAQEVGVKESEVRKVCECQGCFKLNVPHMHYQDLLASVQPDLVSRSGNYTGASLRSLSLRVLEKSQSHGEDGNAQEVCFKLKKAKNIYHVMEDEFKSAELSEAYSGLE
ncbi:uncharacterized [Tachysurus ichikawai]